MKRKKTTNKGEKGTRRGEKADSGRSRSRGARPGEPPPRVWGDHSANARGQQKERAAIIPLDKQRYHLAPEPAYLAIRQDRFEAVADLHAVLAVLGGQQDQHAAVALLGTNPPARRQPDRKLLDRQALERADSHDRNLRAGHFVHFLGEGAEPRLALRIEHPGKVIHVALRLELFDVFPARGMRAGAKNQRDEQQAPPVSAVLG